MTLKFIKIVACSVLATLLIGCGKKDADSSSSGSSSAYSPKVASDAVAVIAFGNAQKCKLAPALEKAGLTQSMLMERLEEEAKQIKDLLVDAGLDKTETQWMLISIGEVKGVTKGNVPNIAFAAAFDHDFGKMISAFQNVLKKEDCKSVELRQTTIADVTAYEILCDDFKVDGTRIVPCIASLKGKLLLGASSLSVLEKQIALYRDGKGTSDDFANFTLGSDDLVKVSVAKVGLALRDAMGENIDNLKFLNEVIPNGDEMVKGIGTVELAVVAASDTDCRLAVSAVMASKEDAESIRAFAKSGLQMVTAQLQKQTRRNPDLMPVVEALKKAKVAGEDKSVEASVSINVTPFLDEVSKQLKK